MLENADSIQTSEACLNDRADESHSWGDSWGEALLAWENKIPQSYQIRKKLRPGQVLSRS